MSLIFIMAAAPILVLLGSLLLLRLPLMKSAPIAYLISTFVAYQIWEMPFALLFGGTMRGTLLAVDLLIIVFGALLFLEFLKQSNIAHSLQCHIVTLSPDSRIQAVVICWFFGSFLEGSAGFGTPGAIVAPLLVAIGFPAFTSILLALTANSTAVAFGAVGTPVRIGLSILGSTEIAPVAAGFSFIPGLLIPLILTALVIQSSKRPSLRDWFEIVPWSLWAGFAFLLPFYLFSLFGPELPSLLGAPTGLVIITLSIRKKFLLPSRILTLSSPNCVLNSNSAQPPLSLRSAITPYVLLIGVLLTGKWIFIDSNWLIPLPASINYKLNLFNPGFAFLTTMAILSLLWRPPLGSLKTSLFEALKVIGKPFISLFFVSSMVQIMMLSEMVSKTAQPKTGMISTLARGLENNALPFLAPLIGALGSFLAGSATVSNLLLGPVQQEMALNLGYATTQILALQLVGAAAGNMIALPNILAVQATVKESNRESEIISRLIGFCALYLVLTGVLGMAFTKTM